MPVTRKADVDAFVAERTLALVGVSRSGKKFGNVMLKELTAQGYTVYPVHPDAETVDGRATYPSLSELPGPVGGVVIVVPPTKAEQVVRAAHRAGITRVWLQQGAGSPDALAYCAANGITAVDGECLLMFAGPTAWHHRTHRWIWKVLGKLPQ